MGKEGLWVGHDVMCLGVMDTFSLTLTLSRWEREQPVINLLKFKVRGAGHARGFAESRVLVKNARVGAEDFGHCGA